MYSTLTNHTKLQLLTMLGQNQAQRPERPLEHLDCARLPEMGTFWFMRDSSRRDDDMQQLDSHGLAADLQEESNRPASWTPASHH